MLLTDYFRSEPDTSWSFAIQSGVTHGTIRLPEDDDFDPADLSQVKYVADRFRSHGITPVVVEPLPNSLHDHIKLGDSLRDESIEKFIKLMENLHEAGMTTVCFNFMAHYGWTRTAFDIPARGGARVTGFRLDDFVPDGFEISRGRVFENYAYFVRAAVPYAERYGIKLALHPDDPPLDSLGSVGRIFTSLDAVVKGINVVKSENLGVTFCQACYRLMGEELENAISTLSDKIFFVHFRNVYGTKRDFRETFHDNGEIDMKRTIGFYKKYCKNGAAEIPIRVDHVPTYREESIENAGYDSLGRLFALGYLKGLLEE